MGPDGLCLVCGLVPPPGSRGDFLVCSCPPETEQPFLNERGLKAPFLAGLRAIEPSDLNLLNHGAFFKRAGGWLDLVVIESKMKRENNPPPFHPL